MLPAGLCASLTSKVTGQSPLARCRPVRFAPKLPRVLAEAPKRHDFSDPSRYPDAPGVEPAREPVTMAPDVQEAVRAKDSPEEVMAREQDLDLHAVSHQDRAEANQHTFPELIHGQPGEQARQPPELSEEQRKLMEEHMAGKEEEPK